MQYPPGLPGVNWSEPMGKAIEKLSEGLAQKKMNIKLAKLMEEKKKLDDEELKLKNTQGFIDTAQKVGTSPETMNPLMQNFAKQSGVQLPPQQPTNTGIAGINSLLGGQGQPTPQFGELTKPGVPLVNRNSLTGEASLAGSFPAGSQIKDFTPQTDTNNMNSSQIAIAQALADRRLPISVFNAYRGKPEGSMILAKALEIDPSFDAAQYPAQAALRLDYTTPKGAAGKSLLALNTVIPHLATLKKLGLSLDNSSPQAWNLSANKLATWAGKPGVTNFNVAKIAVSDEMSNILK